MMIFDSLKLFLSEIQDNQILLLFNQLKKT